jgi:hypothetical protein
LKLNVISSIPIPHAIMTTTGMTNNVVWTHFPTALIVTRLEGFALLAMFVIIAISAFYIE